MPTPSSLSVSLQSGNSTHTLIHQFNPSKDFRGFSNTHVKFEGFSSSRKANKQKMNWVRLAEHGRIPTTAKYMNPRISFDGLNWWISVCVEFPDCRETLNDDGVGIDLGIKDLAVCSDGTKYKNINKSQKVKKLEKQKRRLQRSISRSYEKNKKGESYNKLDPFIAAPIFKLFSKPEKSLCLNCFG